jgi:dUTP pyrophosphatase
MKIKIKYHNEKCKLESHGNWIDLKSSENITMTTGQHKLIKLGVSMKLPKYFQANIVPRSSTYKQFGLLQANHLGVIDGPDSKFKGYSGNDDIWRFNAISFQGGTEIKVGDRICQFEIRPTMQTPWYVWLKWIFSTKIEFIEVDDLRTKNRGGFGTSGK